MKQARKCDKQCWLAKQFECDCICLGINHGKLIRKIMEDQDYWTIKAMHKFGGSFIKALAELAVKADPHNLLKIKLTWEEYWAEYEKKGAELQAEQMNKYDYSGN